MRCGTSALARMLPAATTPSAAAARWVPSVFLPENEAVPPLPSTSATWRYSMWLASAFSRSSASAADSPEAMRSRPRGPRVGSVTFWVATAPTLARAWAQRAATAGLEEETAMPIMPVRWQRAEMEKVMGRVLARGTVLGGGSRLIRYDGDRVHLDQPFRPGQRGDDQPGRDRKHPPQVHPAPPLDRLPPPRLATSHLD